jgi:tRNA threonylcarbamoyladenosine biosynthesis protein TsaB
MRWLNIGIADDGRAIGEIAINAGRRQSELLPASVESLLSLYGACLGDVTLIAATVGPGYYSGIRVGLSYSAALAESLGVMLAPVSTLRALARGAAEAGFLAAPVIRARCDAVYCAVYDSGAELIPPSFLSPHEFMEAARGEAGGKGDLAVVGEEALMYDEIRESGVRIIPRVPAIGLDVALLASSGPRADPVSVRAVYLRSPG